MKKPSIAIFCQGCEPTAEELALFQKFAYYSPVGYNVANLSDSDLLIFDGACGAVPDRFADKTTADDVVKAYEDYLETLGAGVGGQAPEAPETVEEVANEEAPETPTRGRGRATAQVGFTNE